MAGLDDVSPARRKEIAEEWLVQLNSALTSGNYENLAGLFDGDGYWRDLLTFGWKLRSHHGAERIGSAFEEHYPQSGCRGFHLDGEPYPGRLGEFGQTLEFFITFETSNATGRGHVRLRPDMVGVFRAFTLGTALGDLKAFPERFREQRRHEVPATAHGQQQNWTDRREARREFRERDPEVLIIGAGMAGLMTAARLEQLDIPTLLVDRHERVGDVWRRRYRSLTLHNEICTNHFPYLPFPDTWPVFVPKDKLANWMEFYADAMELNVWGRSNFLGGTYDADHRWTVKVERADGSVRTMRPSHVIMAIGVSGLPHIPTFLDRERFAGPIMHSSGDTDALDVAGKSVLVVGTGVSGHDVAQDIHMRGGRVTMLQRSATSVVSLEPSSTRVHELFKRNEGVRSIDDIDLMAVSVPYELVCRLQGELTKSMAEDDRELLDGLRRAGFLLDDTGYFVKLLESQGGYYLNVGCSDLIVEGKIKVRSAVEIVRLTERSAVLSDGSEVEAEVIVLATGYEPLQLAVGRFFGEEVAARVGPIWGLGADGELRNMYARTAQEGLYITGGGFIGCRTYSHYTARLIKATLEGLLPPRTDLRAETGCEHPASQAGESSSGRRMSEADLNLVS